MTRYLEHWRRLLPTRVAVSEATPGELEVHPDEESVAERFSEARRSHFAAGRRCARAAMAVLGGDPEPVLASERRPLWPDGWVGSISHTHDYAVAAVARSQHAQALGIDVERRRPISEAVAERITTPAELAALPSAGADGWITVLFSAKEAFYKLQHPLTGTFLGFRDVRVEVEPGGHLQLILLEDVGALSSQRVFAGRFHRADAHVLTTFSLVGLRDQKL
ncbi:MAG: 4'-phosphopantetheinyl transferase superfamily protein [Deltaproteobacteria bacterium]|nr:4'-phosphopantetheinyl transferase superfamily protein [Deltaproteobacteria bacterium]